MVCSLHLCHVISYQQIHQGHPPVLGPLQSSWEAVMDPACFEPGVSRRMSAWEGSWIRRASSPQEIQGRSTMSLLAYFRPWSIFTRYVRHAFLFCYHDDDDCCIIIHNIILCYTHVPLNTIFISSLQIPLAYKQQLANYRLWALGKELDPLLTSTESFLQEHETVGIKPFKGIKSWNCNFNVMVLDRVLDLILVLWPKVTCGRVWKVNSL